MRWCLLFALLLSNSMCLPHNASGVDEKALREAITLPTVNVSFGTLASIMTSPVNTEQVRARAAALRKQLSGTPRDTGILLEMYDLYTRMDVPDGKRKELLHKAASLAKGRLARSPRDAETWLHLGRAYSELERYAEGERALRKALQLNSRSWKAWTELAKTLYWQSYAVLTSGVLDKQPLEAGDSPSGERLQELIQKWNLTAAKRQEAERCLERAAALAPREPSVHEMRLSFGLLGSVMPAAWSSIGGDSAGQGVSLLTPKVRESLDKLTQLQPDNPNTQVMRVMLLFMRPAARDDEGMDWDKMSAHERREYQIAVTNLQRIARSSDKRRATWALRALAFARFFVRQFRDLAMTDLRRAISLVPEEKENHEVLVSFLAGMNRKAEAIATCEQWLKMKDNPAARKLLAKLLHERGETDKAMEHLHTALRQAPRDIEANLLMAAALLKGGRSPDEAQRLLDVVAPMMREGLLVEQRAWFLTLRGVQLALQDNLAGARWFVARAQALQPGRTDTENIWKTLNP